MGKPFNDLTNNTYGFWTVTGPHKSVPRPDGHGNRTHWFCTCKCGNTAWVDATNLRQGISQSCGCMPKKVVAGKGSPAALAAAIANRTHGRSGDRVYKIWFKMKQRCEYPKDTSYRWYGAKGIRVCERWQSFENFLADMGEPPSDKHEIERLNHSRDYEPHNCKWIEGKLQTRNTSATIRVPSGESLAEYCETHHLNYQAVYDYYVRKHLPLQRAVELAKHRC